MLGMVFYTAHELYYKRPYNLVQAVYSLQEEVPDDQGLIIIINTRGAHCVM